MLAFTQLGLSDDADERAIKRAYAQRLRITRPEDDPEGFQRLHAAYQAALDYCRKQALQALPVPGTQLPIAQSPADVVESDGVVRARDAAEDRFPAQGQKTVPARTPLAPAAAFSVDDFCEAAIAVAWAGDAPALTKWLGEHPALWSLQTKSRTGVALVTRLYREAPPMSEACLATLLHFFDLDHVLAGHDPLALLQLQRRMQLGWELRSEHRAELVARLQCADKAGARQLDNVLQQLMRPFDWPQVLFSGLQVNKATRIAKVVRQLAGNDPDALPASIQRAQLAFWLTAADRTRVTRPRLRLGLVRCVAALVAAVLLGLLMGVVFAVAPDSFISGPLEFLLAGVADGALLWAVVMAVIPLENWHSRREQLPAKWPWLCLGLVPLSCAAGLMAIALGYFTIGLVTVLLAGWLMLCRYWRHRGKNLRVNKAMIWIAVFVPWEILQQLKNTDYASDAIAMAPFIIAALAMLAWLGDLWRNWKSLRVRRTQRRSLGQRI